jgi:hypothetical protein
MSKHLIHDVAMATTQAVLDRLKGWSGEAEYREAFLAVFPAVQGGLTYLIEHYRHELKRLAKPVPPPSEN